MQEIQLFGSSSTINANLVLKANFESTRSKGSLQLEFLVQFAEFYVIYKFRISRKLQDLQVKTIQI